MATIDLYSKGQTDALLGNKADTSALTQGLAGKQDTLVSGTNIKTINGTSILGAGNMVISGGGSTVSLTDNGSYWTLGVE